jgi:hypothetical protein
MFALVMPAKIPSLDLFAHPFAPERIHNREGWRGDLAIPTTGFSGAEQESVGFGRNGSETSSSRPQIPGLFRGRAHGARRRDNCFLS